MKDPKQVMRYSEDELSLIKALFADSNELAYIIRKVLLQFTLTGAEKESLALVMTGPAVRLMRKVFTPIIDPDAPLFQLTHMALALGSDMKGLSPDGAWPLIAAKQIEMEYIGQQVSVMLGEDVEELINFSELVNTKYSATEKGKEQAYINLTAWNFLLSFIDSHISALKTLAGKKTETVEETQRRLLKDSNK